MNVLDEGENNKTKNYNDILSIEVIDFKKNYTKQVEKYLNKKISY